MELIYYSYYPYEDPDYRIVKDEDGNDLCAQPFRLYKAAVCKSLIDFQSEEDFVLACFEAMDSPDCRIKGYQTGKPYKDSDFGVEVFPTKHFYGCTNSADGVYCINHTNYVKSHKLEAYSWRNALLKVYNFHAREYATKLIDLAK